MSNLNAANDAGHAYYGIVYAAESDQTLLGAMGVELGNYEPAGGYYYARVTPDAHARLREFPADFKAQLHLREQDHLTLRALDTLSHEQLKAEAAYLEYHLNSPTLGASFRDVMTSFQREAREALRSWEADQKGEAMNASANVRETVVTALSNAITVLIERVISDAESSHLLDRAESGWKQLNALVTTRSRIYFDGPLPSGREQQISALHTTMLDAENFLNEHFAVTNTEQGRRAVAAVNDLRVARSVLVHGPESARSCLPITPREGADKASLAIVEAAMAAAKPIDPHGQLFDSSGYEHSLQAASSTQIVTKYAGIFYVWDRKTGASLMADADGRTLSNTAPDPALLASKQAHAKALWEGVRARASGNEIDTPSM